MAVSTKADMALIQGAKDVGKSMMPADLSGLDKITKAGTDMAVGALGEIQKIEQEKVDANDAFTEAANEVELASGSLGKVLYDDTVDFAQTAKNDYLTALKAGDQKGMMAAKKAMQDRSQFTQQHKAFITDLAKLQSAGDLSKGHTKEENAYMTAVLKGDYKVERNDKGEMVFNVNGEKKTNAEFEDMHILKNYKLGTTLGELNGAVGKSSTFDDNSIKNTIAQSLPKNVKEFRAALHDDLGGGASFKQLLEKDTTLKDEILIGMGYDPNGDGILDDTEKNNFIGAVTDHNNPNFNLEVSSRIMAEKMTEAVRNNHTKHWEGVALAAQNKIIQEQEMLDYKNRLAGDLDDEKSANRTEEAEAKFKNEKKLLKQKEDNLVNREQDKKAKIQQDVKTFWSEQNFNDDRFRQKGPTDKMKLYNEAIRTATGSNDINLKYSANPFEDAMGRSVQSGYYVVRNEDVIDLKTGEVTGNKKAVKQVIGIGEDITAENIMSLIDPEKSIAIPSNNMASEGTGR
tara:strand:- start:4134 stop:5678 length:1545 start_codon:yes stop_codon:yes gene_type:complete